MSENTLEDLRSKIIQSMTGKKETSQETKATDGKNERRDDNRANTRRPYQDNNANRHNQNIRNGNRQYQDGSRYNNNPHYNKNTYNNAAQYNNNMSREAYYQNTNNPYLNVQKQRYDHSNNNNKNNKNNNNSNSYNRGQNNRYQVAKPQQNQKRLDINYRDPAFLLITKSKSACHIIVRMVDVQSLDTAVSSRDKIKIVISNLFHDTEIALQPLFYDPEFNAENKTATFNIVTSEPEDTTKILALQQFITATAEVKEFLTWSRPQNYVKNNSLVCKYSNQDLLVLRNTEINGKTKGEVLQNMKSVSSDQTDLLEPLFYKPSPESDPIFTNTTILLLKRAFTNSTFNWKVDGPGAEIIKVNDGKYMFQNLEYLHFQNFPSLVSRQVRHPSNILLLLNCIDPMDLKEKLNISELKESIRNLLKVEPQSIQVVIPTVDYRISVYHVKELAGNIFVTFNSIEDATTTMQQLAGYDFFGRTILCAYASQADVNTPGISFE